MTKWGYTYYLAGSGANFGTMVCQKCKETIISQFNAFLVYTESEPEDGWKYVTFHRRCWYTDKPWQMMESQLKAREAELEQAKTDLLEFLGKWNTFNLQDLYEALLEEGTIQ